MVFTSLLVIFAALAQPRDDDSARLAAAFAKSALFQKLPEFSRQALQCLAGKGIEGYQAGICGGAEAQKREPFADLSRALYRPVADDARRLQDKFGKCSPPNPDKAVCDSLTDDEKKIHQILDFQTKLCVAGGVPMKTEIYFRNLPASIDRLDPGSIAPYSGGKLSREQAMLLAANPAFRFGAETEGPAPLDLGLRTTLPTFFMGYTTSSDYYFNVSPEIAPHDTSFLARNDEETKQETELKHEGVLYRRKLFESDPGLRELMLRDALFERPGLAWQVVHDADKSMLRFFVGAPHDDDGHKYPPEVTADLKRLVAGSESYYSELSKAGMPDALKAIMGLVALEDGTVVGQSGGCGLVGRTLDLGCTTGRRLPQAAFINVDGEQDVEGYYRDPKVSRKNEPKTTVLTVEELKKRGLSEATARRFLAELRRHASGADSDERERAIAKAQLSSPEAVKASYELARKFMEYRQRLYDRRDKNQNLIAELLGLPKPSPYACAAMRQHLQFDLAMHRSAVGQRESKALSDNLAKLESDSKRELADVISSSKFSDHSKGIFAKRVQGIPFKMPVVKRAGFQDRLAGMEKFMDGFADQVSTYPPPPEMARAGLRSFMNMQEGNANYGAFMSANGAFDPKTEDLTVDAGFLIPQAGNEHQAFVQFVALHELGHAISPTLPAAADKPELAISKESRKTYDALTACMKDLAMPYMSQGVNISFEENFADLIGMEGLARWFKKKSGPEALLSKARFVEDILAGICSTAHSDWDPHSDHKIRYLRFLLNPSLAGELDDLVKPDALGLTKQQKTQTKDCGGILWAR
jgi:hypothetical protein